MNDEDIEFNETPSSTPDFKTDLARALQALLPEAVADGKVDLVKLKELLGNDAGNDSERFGLFWPGKKVALRAAQEPTTATLSPDRENSKDWDNTQNVFIEGDNLEVLKILQRHYHGKIKMIYIDPPYNTGKDFIYPDNYKEGLATYLEWTRQVNEDGKKVSTNTESEGRYHSNWLNMMYPRLKLARNLLTEDGVFVSSIGTDEVGNLHKLVTEVFGESNFIALVPRVSKTTSDSGDFFAPSVDYLIFASRDRDSTHEFTRPLDAEDIKSYTRSDARGRYKTVGFYQASLTLERSRNARYYIETPDGSMAIPPENKRWRTVRETYDRFLQNDEIVFIEVKNSPLFDSDGKQSKWNVYTKQYLDRRMNEGRTPRDFIADYPNVLGTKNVKALEIPFDFPKPVELIKYLMTIVGVTSSDIVLDFFSGSATTAHAVMELNAEDGGERRHVQVQLPEPSPEDSDAHRAGFKTIAEIARRRIDLAGEKIRAQLEGQLNGRTIPLDVGFRTFRLVDTNFSKWRVPSDIAVDVLSQRLLELRDSADDHATPDALLTEILVKQGYSLTETIDTTEVSGLQVQSIGDGLLLAYLDERKKPTLEQLRAIVDAGPARIVILEDAFLGDDELKTNLAQLCKSKNIELWTA
jgi:adenine-specific DNA-methyltransferase